MGTLSLRQAEMPTRTPISANKSMWSPGRLSLGSGYRAIANELAARGICSCTKSSIERMVKGWCCYTGGFLLP